MTSAEAPPRDPPAVSRRPAPAAPHELRTRLLASLVLVPVFLGAVAVGGRGFLGAILALTAVAAWELAALAALKGFPVRRWPAVGLAVAFPALLFFNPGSAYLLMALITAGVVGVSLAQLFGPGEDGAIAGVAATVFAATYVGALFGHFVLVREIPARALDAPYATGAVLLAVPLLLTWTNDSAAYAIGRRWGRRKLMPGVSPGKSVEGAVGALFVTVAAAVPLLMLVERWVPAFGPLDAVALGLVVGFAAPLGDLVESSFKRDAGVKDVSHLIPGHGGVLDRFDSLLFVVPITYYYLRAWVV